MFHNMLISYWISTALVVLKRRVAKCVDNGKVFHRLLTWFSTNLSSILSALQTPRLVGAGRHIFRHLSEPFWKTAISSCQHQSYFQPHQVFCTFLYQFVTAKLHLYQSVLAIAQMNHSVTFQPCLVAEMIDSTPQRIGIHSQVAHTQGFEKQPESFQIVYQISEYQANKLVKPCYFCYLLWQLARFRCGSWRVFVVAVGTFSLWQLAQLIVFRSMFVI